MRNFEEEIFEKMALFHFKQTRATDLMAEGTSLRVKPDEKLMRMGERQQTSCCSSSMTSWSSAGPAEQERGGGGGGQGGRDIHLAGVDLGLVMIQTVGEEMARIQQERSQWMHRISGS